MKRFNRILFAIIALTLASLACDVRDWFNVAGRNFTKAGIQCEYEVPSTNNYTCRCPINSNVIPRLGGTEIKNLTDEEFYLLVCGVTMPNAAENGTNDTGSTSQNEAQETEPPVIATVTPTATPLPPPIVNRVAACSYADKYVNIEMQTDASFNAQALTVRFQDANFAVQASCELVSGASNLYTCRIPNDSMLPAKLELSYFGKSFYNYDLTESNCNTSDNGRSPDQPADNENDGGTGGDQPPLDCSATPFPPGCK